MPRDQFNIAGGAGASSTVDVIARQTINQVVAEPGTTVPALKTRIINGNIWTNPTIADVTVPASTTDASLEAAGLVKGTGQTTGITEVEARNLILSAPASKTYEVSGQAELTPPSVSQYADPPDNAVAQVIHMDKQIREIWSYDLLSTTWTRDRVEDLSATGSDQVKIVVSGDAVENVAPTAGQYANPADGNDAIKVLTDGTTEYWTHNGTAWAQGTSVDVPAGITSVATIALLPDPDTHDGEMVIVLHDMVLGDDTYGSYMKLEDSPGSDTYFWERTEGSTGAGAVAASGDFVYARQATPPAITDNGQWWFDTGSGLLKVSNLGAWVDVGA